MVQFDIYFYSFASIAYLLSIINEIIFIGNIMFLIDQ